MATGPGFIDAQGIYQYGEADDAGPLFSDFLNLLADSTSAAIAADRVRLTAAEALLGDSGWINATLGGGWGTSAGLTAKYRRKNGVVYLTGRLSGGAAGTMFTLPAGFRPAQACLFIVANGTNATSPAAVTINTDGTVTSVASVTPNLSALAFVLG